MLSVTQMLHGVVWEQRRVTPFSTEGRMEASFPKQATWVIGPESGVFADTGWSILLQAKGCSVPAHRSTRSRHRPAHIPAAFTYPFSLFPPSSIHMHLRAPAWLPHRAGPSALSQRRWEVEDECPDFPALSCSDFERGLLWIIRYSFCLHCF